MSLKTPDPSQRVGRSYAEILMDQRLRKEEVLLQKPQLVGNYRKYEKKNPLKRSVTFKS